MTGYEVKIKDSSRELTAKERIAMKDVSEAIRLDEATAGNSRLTITPAGYVILAVHNEKSDNVDYDNYIIIDKDGTKYVTGSDAFWSTFIGIWDEMSGENEEWGIEAYRLPSKNYKGKDFLTCSII
jgi:hypothetical protein